MNLKNVFQVQTQFFSKGETKLLVNRKKQLLKLKKGLEVYENEMYEAIFKDFGKSKFETFTTEIGLLYKEIDSYIKNMKAWTRPKRVRTNLTNIPGTSTIYKEPLGVTLVIGAWNYPYLLSLSPVIASIAAGNTVVVKPSELPQRTSNVMYKLVSEYCDIAYVTVVEGGVPETSSLLALPFDKIFFTGSPKVGQIVYEAAAKNMVPVTLELGGKSPAVVMPSVNLKVGIKRLVWGKFMNGGQTCIAPDYVLVHNSIKGKVIDAIRREINRNQYKVENNNYTNIINEANYTRLMGYLEGQNIIQGGVGDPAARSISPTIVLDPALDSPIMQEEIFGPLMPIIGFDTLEEAIAIIEARPKPLALYCFSERKRDFIALNNLSFGGGAINDTVVHITNERMPFGGVGNSGIGNYHGRYGIDTFSHQKSLLNRPTWFELPIKYYPLTATKLKWIQRLFKL